MFQNGPRGPAAHPRPAAPRPAPTPAVRQLVNPVTPYRPPAPPQAHLAHLSGRTSPVAAFQAQGRSTANTSGSPAHATTQRLARAIGGRPQPVTAARTALGQALLRLYGGPDRAFMLPTDPIQSNRAMRRQNTIGTKLATMGQFNQDFKNLLDAGLLPKGARQPPLIFSTHGASGPADGRSYEKNGTIYLSPYERALVGSPRWPGRDGTWAKQTLIHELAHTLQSKKTLSSVPDREGGAQAFTDAATPRVLGPLPTNLDSNYTGYVNRVRSKKGNQWIMQGQFR